MARRVREFVGAYLGLSPEEAQRRRREGGRDYGSTLEWLRGELGFTDVEAYYRAVHPPDEAETLPPDPALRSFLEGLPVPRAILTNSPREHADRILRRLGIEDLFPEIFDIRRNGFRGKPRREVYYRALETLGASPEGTLFIDDHPGYVEGYLAIGGRGLLLDEGNAFPDYGRPKISRLGELTNFLD